MTTTQHQDKRLDKLCKAAIEQRLGNISSLPEELAFCISKIYRKFIVSYLNMLRQKENKPADWTPEYLSIDAELTDGMRHFFSDYQHITKEYYQLNQKIDRLQELDKDSHHKLYQHRMEEILTKYCQQVGYKVRNEDSG